VRATLTVERASEILARLDPVYADLTCGLRFANPLQLLVATILSAQCTDERVNMVTPGLFSRYPLASDYAGADTEELEAIIHSCGFFRNKAKSIRAMAQALVERHNGDVPATMEELVALPGVARKTANVVLTHAFGRNEGIAVDTHVQRLSHRLGLSDRNGPEKIERDLMALVPRHQWGRLGDVLIWHGRKICGARKPACLSCPVSDLCPSAYLDT
jgi:endonuclease III